MRTTIDAAGRIVVPKAMRDALGLEAGRALDLVLVDGRIELELAPLEVTLEQVDGLPLLRPAGDVPPLTDEMVRRTIEATRR